MSHARLGTVGAGLRQEKAEVMKCALCRTGETKPGTTTETYEIGGTVVVVRGVPADVCQQCGETYTNEDTMRQLERIVGKGALPASLSSRSTRPRRPNRRTGADSRRPPSIAGSSAISIVRLRRKPNATEPRVES